MVVSPGRGRGARHQECRRSSAFSSATKHAPFYARNVSLFVLPLLTGYFAWKRGLNRDDRRCCWRCRSRPPPCSRTSIPSRPTAIPGILTALHLPIALWLAVGVAYAGGRWFAGGARMDFVRFSGELFIYYVLIALGGGVLTAFTMMMFKAIGMNVEWLAGHWIIPCGAMGAVIVGSWLVEAKQSVVENMAPVLTRLFTPLFTVVLLVFLATMAWTGSPIRRGARGADRVRPAAGAGRGAGALRGVGARSAGAAGPVRRAAAAADRERPAWWTRVALAAIAARISEFGFTPNRMAALGENLILLVNLAWSAWLYARFLRGRRPFARARALADRLPARVFRLGRARRHRLPAALRLPLSHGPGRRTPVRAVGAHPRFAHSSAGENTFR